LDVRKNAEGATFVSRVKMNKEAGSVHSEALSF
jgi:hypothetical protein